jgi:hypothetical protein
MILLKFRNKNVKFVKNLTPVCIVNKMIFNYVIIAMMNNTIMVDYC